MTRSEWLELNQTNSDMLLVWTWFEIQHGTRAHSHEAFATREAVLADIDANPRLAPRLAPIATLRSVDSISRWQERGFRLATLAELEGIYVRDSGPFEPEGDDP